MRRKLLTSTLIIFSLLVFVVNTYAEKRVALIIGNSEYISNGYHPLSQPVNDAEAFDKALKSFGFETIVVKNGTQEEMTDSLLEFVSILDGADAAVFYYSGHGNSINHEEYIIPAKTKFRPVALESQFLNLNAIVKEMELRSKLSLIFYDACRNEPNAQISITSRTKGGSFIGTYMNNQLMICYATAQGKTASAGDGSELSPFTEVIIDNIYKQEDFESLWYNSIRNDNRLSNQVPQNSGGIAGGFYFNKPRTLKEFRNNDDYNLSQIKSENIVLRVNSLISNGNSHEASKLLLEYISQDTTYNPQIESCLRTLVYLNSSVIKTKSMCRPISFSPDNKYIVSGSENGRIYVYETKSGLLIKDFEGHKKDISSISFNPNNSQMVTASYDKTLKLWNSKDWTLQKCLPGHNGIVFSARFNKRGDKIISASSDSTIRIWNASNGKLLQTYKETIGYINYAEFSPNDKTFLEVSADSLIRIRSINSGKIVKTLKHKHPILSASYSPSSRYIISSSYEGNIKIWDAETYEELKSFKYDFKEVNQVKFSSCEEFIIAQNLVGPNIMQINPENGKIMQVFDKHTDWVYSTSISTDSKLLASSSEDETIRLWNLQPNNCTKLKNIDMVFDALFTPMEDNILTRGFRGDNSGRGRLDLWNQDNGSLIQTFEIEEPIGCIAISPNNKYFAISMDIWDNTPILLYDIEKKHVINQISKECVNSLCFSPSSDKLVVAYGFDSPNLEVYDVEKGVLLKVINISSIHSGRILDACYSPNNELIITSSRDGSIGLINADDFSTIAALKGHTHPVLQSIVNNNNTLIYSASSDKSVKIWDLETKVCIDTLLHDKTIRSISLSPNGNWLVTGGDDKHIRVWNAINGDLIWDFQLNDKIEKVAFSPSGQQILSITSSDVLIWNFSSFECILEETKKIFTN